MYELLTTEEAKRFLKITSDEYDDILADIIPAVSREIELYCGRKFITRQYTEFHDGEGKNNLYVMQYPVYSVTTLHDDPDHDYGSNYLISTDDYRIYYDRGEIKLTESEYKFSKGQQNVKIVYWAGYSRFEVLDETNNYIDIAESTSTDYPVEIAANTSLINTSNPGYTAEVLASTLQTALNASDDLSNTYTVAYNHKTQKFTISADANFTIKWQNGTNSDKSLYYLLGFAKVDTSSATSHESEYAVNGVPDDLQLAASQMVNYYLDESREGKNLARITKSIMPAGQGTMEYIRDLPRGVFRILDRYSRVML